MTVRGAGRVLDLGCSYGNLLRRLMQDRQFEEVVGFVRDDCGGRADLLVTGLDDYIAGRPDLHGRDARRLACGQARL